MNALRTVLVGVVMMAMAAVAAGQAGGGAGAVRPMPGGGMFGWGGAGQFQFDSYLRMVADMNMSPDFALEKAQKEKIVAVKDEFKKATEKFMADNKDEMAKIQDGYRDAGRDPQKWQELGKQSQELMAKGPKAQEYIDKVKAALTADQVKALDEKAKQAEEENRARMEQWRKAMPAEKGPQNPQ